MAKRFLAALLIAFMLLPLFVACNQDDDINGDPKDTEESSGESTDGNNKENAPEDNKTDKDENKTPAAEDNVLKILTIGNSFSDDTMEYVYQIAKSAGVENIKLGNLYIGGCSLNTHAENAKKNKSAYEYRTNSNGTWSTTKNVKMRNALLSENWDFISLQQVSGSSGKADTYSQLEYMITYVKNLVPEAKLVWNMTWAYQQDSTHVDFPKYDSNQMTMYQSIVSAVKGKVLTNNDISIIVPNGTAVQNARTSYVGDTLTRDGYHLSLDRGRYLAGLTFFYALTGTSIENLSYKPDGVDEKFQQVAIESAINAVAKPYEVVTSAYQDGSQSQIPSITPPEGDYERLNLKLTALGYYNTKDSGRPMQIISDASNSKSYYASKRFTKEEIPVGSIILLAEGWKYRPEAWELGSNERPGEVFEESITVTEEWWAGYSYRAFNLSKTGNPSLENVSPAEIEGAFAVFVPKSAQSNKVVDTSSWDQDGVLKILMIGNSFSQDTMQHMAMIAKSAGVESVKLCNLYIGGCSLWTHADKAKNDAAAYQYEDYSTGTRVDIQNYKMSDAIKAENWDFISLQQASNHSGNADTYNEDLDYLISYVKELCPDATLVWNMTWAYQQDSTHSAFPNYNSDQMTMYNCIISAVKSKIATNSNFSVIVPNGTAVQNARTSYVGDNITRDGYHLSLDFGRYIAGLTFFSAVTGISINDIEYMPNGVDPFMQKIAIESARDAIANPYDIMASSYPVFEIDEAEYERLEINWTALGYYNTNDTNGRDKEIICDANNSKEYYATQIFTKTDIPVGSVIVVADGWKYRPEAWDRNGATRPDNVSVEYIVVTEAWWGSFTERAFNISKKASSVSLEGISESEIDEIFVIYIPKN